MLLFILLLSFTLHIKMKILLRQIMYCIVLSTGCCDKLIIVIQDRQKQVARVPWLSMHFLYYTCILIYNYVSFGKTHYHRYYTFWRFAYLALIVLYYKTQSHRSENTNFVHVVQWTCHTPITAELFKTHSFVLMAWYVCILPWTMLHCYHVT